MRYVRPQEYPLNPRVPVDLLDGVADRLQRCRRTFQEPEILAEVWAAGEDVRLREDPRFWELERIGHFHLAQQRLANRLLADRLWKGLWSGSNIDDELAGLDVDHPEAFHVFCEADPQFRFLEDRYVLVARPRHECSPELAGQLDGICERLLAEHCALGSPKTTQDLLDLAGHLGEWTLSVEDALDNLEAWLSSNEHWTEIARGLWLPTSLVPNPEKPKPFRLRAVRPVGAAQATGEVEFLENGDEPVAAENSVTQLMLPDPPVERHPDASVSWTHTLRTVHLHANYLPVPTGARFRYPRFVGRSGPVAIHAVGHDTGDQGLLWLDREHHRFFGDFLRSLIEWDEAGRRLHVRWTPDALVITHGEVDLAAQDEERRLIDPEAIDELRRGLGESYRQSIAAILQERGPLTFRLIYEQLATRVGHRPSRGSIRSVLVASPEFEGRGKAWAWHSVPDAARTFRRTIVLTGLGFDPSKGTPDVSALAHAASGRVTEIADSLAPFRRTGAPAS
jgi:hypothetical protein